MLNFKIMKQLFYFILLGVFAISCTQNKSSNNQTKNDSTVVEKPTNIALAEGKSCYLGVVGKDSAKLEIDRTGANFNGFLSYKRFESDSSLGEINGTISGDTLKGSFNFMSEGMISVSDTYFLVKDGKLLEGWGNIVNVDDMTVRFENPSQLTYGQGFVLNPTDCVADFIPKAHKDFYYDFKKK